MSDDTFTVFKWVWSKVVQFISLFLENKDKFLKVAN